MFDLLLSGALVQLFRISGSSTSTSTTKTTGTTPRIQMYARPLGAITVIMGLVVLVTGTSKIFFTCIYYKTTPHCTIHSCHLKILTLHPNTGLVRYFTIQTALTKGCFPVARVIIAFIAIVLSTLVVIVFGVLVGVRRQD